MKVSFLLPKVNIYLYNIYCLRKRTQQPESKTLIGLFTFYIMLNTLGKEKENSEFKLVRDLSTRLFSLKTHYKNSILITKIRISERDIYSPELSLTQGHKSEQLTKNQTHFSFVWNRYSLIIAKSDTRIQKWKTVISLISLHTMTYFPYLDILNYLE